MENKKNPVRRYMTQYMSIGMCFGPALSLLFGMLFHPNNIGFGFCFGIPITMIIGMVLGMAKDKRLSENMMVVRNIENVKDSSDVIIFVSDKDKIEKQYRINEKKMKEEKFSKDDRVAEEIYGSLVSLESK